MKSVLFATADLFRNAFHRRGRLSREGYWRGWLGVLLVNLALDTVRRLPVWPKAAGEMLLWIMGLWNLAAFFPLLFGGIRRYHDCGRPGWQAVTLFLLVRLCLLSGLVLGGMTLLFFLFSAGAEVEMKGFLGLMGGSALLLLAGAVLCVLNIRILLHPPDPGENAYGAPEPFAGA